MALTDLTRISTSGIATGSTIDAAILRKDVSFRGSQVGVTSSLFDSSADALEFNDNVKLKFGDGGDLNLYHTGSHSYIQDNGTGNLIIDTNGFSIRLTYNDSENMLRAIRNDAVELYWDNSKKFQTTKHGAVVTGILTATKFSGPVVGNTNNASGISTFYDLRVSNNLTVEGTTTTLDTNLVGVDRIEVGADSNTVVGVAITQSGTADIVNLFDGTTEVLTVKDGGFVGVGTINPGRQLHVLGTTRPLEVGSTNLSNIIKLYNSGTGRATYNGFDIKCSSTTGGGLVFYGGYLDFATSASNGTDGTSRIRILSDGKVGIGSAIPDQKFEIAGGNIRLDKGRRLDFGDQFRALQYTSNDTMTLQSPENVIICIDNNNNETDRIFAVKKDTQNPDDGSGTELFRVQENGNVGIGTSSPYNTGLDVRFPLTTVATFSSLANGTQGADVSIIHTKSGITDNDKVGQISFSGGALGNATTYAQIRAIATDISNKKGDIAFYMRNGNNTTGSLIDDERLRITSDGKVGIGSQSPGGVLDLYHATDNTILNVKSGDAGSVINIIDNATRSSIEQHGVSLKIISDTVGSYANSDIRLQVDGSTKMRINSDGEVLIGTTTNPTADIKLLVSGNGGVSSGSYFSFRGDYGNVPEPAAYAIKFDSSATHLSAAGGLHQYAYGGIAFNLGGKDRVNFKSTGSVGIGTTNSQHKLNLYTENGSNAGGVLIQNINYASNQNRPYLIVGTKSWTGGTNNWDTYGFQHKIKTDSSGVPRITVDGAGGELFCVRNDGKVGIGTDDPNATLEIHADAANQTAFTIHADMGTNNNRTFNIKTPITDSDSQPFVLQTPNALAVRIDTTERFRVNSNGSVGIGTSVPSALLDIEGSGTLAKFGSSDIGNSNYETLFIKNNVASYPAITNESSPDTLELRSAGSVQATIDYNNNDTNKYFRVVANQQGSSGTEVFRVQEDGKSVFKKSAGATNNDYSIVAELNAQTTGSAAANFGPALYLSHTFGGTNYAGSLITSQTDSDVNTTHISFYPRNYGWTEALRITSEGNVDVMNGGELGITTNTNNTSVLSFKNNTKDHKIGGLCVNLADDTISSDIMVPGARHGCLLFIFATSDAAGTYPQPGPCGMVYVDVGASTNIRPMFTQSGVGSDATTNVGNSITGKASHETNINNCDDGKVTVMKGSANGRIKLANRLNATYHFYLTMM